MFRRAGQLLVAIAAFATAIAHGAPTGTVKRPPLSRSVGSPNHGHLENGALLEPGAHIRLLSGYAAGEIRWGTRELVSAIDHAARDVRRKYRDAVLGVGQLSRKGGGEVDRHASHESGRDVDLAFYLTDSAGKPAAREQFLSVRPDGRLTADSSIRFDDARNWALVQAFITSADVRVTHMFVASHLRARLLAYAAKIGVSEAIRTHASETLMQPHRAQPHDDHFHVRISCPAASLPGCIEFPTGGPSKKAATLTRDKPHAKTPRAPTRKIVRARSTGKASPAEATEPNVSPDVTTH